MDKNKKIGVLTYTVPHRKTYDTLCLLKASGYQNIVVFAEDMKYVKKKFPLIQHRPQTVNLLSPQSLCENFGYRYIVGPLDKRYLEEESVVLLCGAGLLEQEVISKYRIINSHPGYIPFSRGLDSLKWAIWNDLPVGVTTHIIGDEIDAGEVIERVEVPVYKEDTFHQLAYRVYETEIRMLVEALEKYRDTMYISGNGYDISKRMPEDIERRLLDKFEDYRSKRG